MQLDFVRWEKSGEEGVYYCPECFRPKFYLNRNGLYTCFSCGMSGKLRSNEIMLGPGTLSLPTTDKPIFSQEDKRLAFDLNYENHSGVQYWLHKRYPTGKYPYPASEKYPVWYKHGEVRFASYLCSGPSGYQAYRHGRRPKYIFRGKRGILVPRSSRETKGVILTEGVMDCLALASRPNTRGWIVLCSYGNKLTEDQLNYLIRWNEYPLALAFDNDKLGAYAEAWSKLTPYFQLINLMPPKTWRTTWKDWDEILSSSLDTGHLSQVFSDALSKLQER